jgi:hypothetical protein
MLLIVIALSFIGGTYGAEFLLIVVFCKQVAPDRANGKKHSRFTIQYLPFIIHHSQIYFHF